MAIRQLTDHEYRINDGSWIGCTSSNTIDNEDGTYTITDGLNMVIPIGGLEVRVKSIEINPPSTVLTNNIAFTAVDLITPVISFNRPDDMVIGGTNQPLDISSTHNTSGVVITSSNPSIATVSKVSEIWYLHVVSAGIIELTATQPSEAGYNAAVPVVVSGVVIASNGSDLMPTNIYTERGIPQAIIEEAVSTLQTDLENASLWTDAVAIYPCVSTIGDLGYKLNLKNPIDSDAAYRLVPSGTLNANGDGITNGSNSLVPNDLFSIYSKSYFIYKRRTANGAWIMGFYDGGSCALNVTNNGFINNEGINPGDLSNGGLLLLNVVNSSKYNVFKGNAKMIEGTPGSATSSEKIGFNGLMSGGSIGFATDSNAFGLAGIFNRGLSDAEVSTLNTITETYSSKLKRSKNQTYNKVYFYGDSITVGSDATNLQGWAKNLSKLMGWDAVISAQGGETITTANGGFGTYPSFLNRYTTDIKTKSEDDKFLFFAYGTNDSNPEIVPSGTVDDYKDGISMVVAYALTKGWSVDDMIFISGYWIGEDYSYHNDIMLAAEQICASLGIEKVFNFYNDMIANNPTNTLHPNTDMHVIMALKIKKYLENQEIYSIWQ